MIVYEREADKEEGQEGGKEESTIKVVSEIAY